MVFLGIYTLNNKSLYTSITRDAITTNIVSFLEKKLLFLVRYCCKAYLLLLPVFLYDSRGSC